MKKNKAKQPGNNAQQASKTHTTPIQSQGNSDFSFSRNQWLILAVLILATVISYWPTLNNGFVNWDDDLYVTENPFINTDVPGNFNKLMNANVAANRHPATMATLALDYKLTGEKDGAFTSAKIYHAQSLVWHLANIFLVFWLVFMLSSSNFFIAIFGAAVFALHPMHVESVAWVSGRKDVVYTFFFLLSCIAYLSNMKQAKTWKYVAALALFTISLAAKPAAVILPVLLVLFDFFFNYQASKTTLAKWVLNTKTWINKIPFFALALLAGIITFKSQGETEALEGKKFFDELVGYMTSGPVLVQVLEGENAIATNRKLMGATNPEDAAPGTIRKEFALNIGENSVHGSDSDENAAIEGAFHFAGVEMF